MTRPLAVASSLLPADDRLIVALDVPDALSGLDLADRLGDSVSFYKIGLGMLTTGGLALANELAEERGKRIFLDLKLFDIGATIEAAVRGLAAFGHDFLTVQGDPQVVRAAAQTKDRMKILAVTYLTSLDRADLDDGLTMPGDISDLVATRAIRAFEANAVNYLMKPVDEDKLADTIERVRQRLAEKKSTDDADRLRAVLSEVAPEAVETMDGDDAEAAARYEKLINVKDRGQIFRVEVGTIEHIEAAGDYMCIYTGDNSLILRETMKDLERRLDPRSIDTG